MSEARLPKTDLFVFPPRRAAEPSGQDLPSPALPSPNVPQPDIMRGAFLSVTKNDRLYPVPDGRAAQRINAGSLIAGAAITALFCTAVIVVQDYPDQAKDALRHAGHRMTEFYCAGLHRPCCR